MINMFYDKVKVQSKTLGFFNQLSEKNKWGMDAEWEKHIYNCMSSMCITIIENR